MINNGLLIILFVWLSGLTYVTFRLKNHYDKLIGGSSKTTLREVLERILNEKKNLAENQEKLTAEVGRIDSEIKSHINRIGIVRFNPFSDTGGSQSFTVALLDDRNNGVVMTSLFARTGNRWYVKEVQAGSGQELELTKEERQAIERARQLTKHKG